MQLSKIVCLTRTHLRVQENIPECTETDKPILVWRAVFALIVCEQTGTDSTTKQQKDETTKRQDKESTTRRLRTQRHNTPFIFSTMNKPTEVLMPAPSTVALTGNIKATVDHNKPIKKLLIFASGASTTESTFGRTRELEDKVLLAYKMRVKAFVFDTAKNIDQFGPLPLGFHTEVAKNELSKEGSGSKIYKIFKSMESQFRMVWTKHIVTKSG